MLVIMEAAQNIIEELSVVEKLSEKKDEFVNFVVKKFKEYTKKIPSIENTLKKNNIDVSAIKRDAVADAKKAKIKDGKIVNFKDDVKKFAENLAANKYTIKKTQKIEEAESKPAAETAVGVLKAVGLLGIVFYANTYFCSIATAITGSFFTGRVITAIFIGPIVEEVSKLVAAKNNFTWEYFTIFNIGEFTLYAQRIMSMGGSFLCAVLIRTPAILMHLYNTFVHEKAKKENKSDEGLKFASTVHMLFNTIGTLAEFALSGHFK